MRYDTFLLQRTLLRAGYDPGPRDGLPGPQTEQALITFQTHHGLTPDGVVGRNTRKALAQFRVRQLAPIFQAVARLYNVDGIVVAAMADVESRLGFLLDRHGKGDNGHGHGLMQIDDRSWGKILGARVWWEDAWSISVGTWIYKSFRDLVERKNPHATPEQLNWAAVAAYNCGPGRIRIPSASLDSEEFWRAIDRYTWAHDHAQRVRRSWEWIAKV